jgi:hypothetical protein
MSRVNSISGEIVILYDTSYALYKVYHALNPLRIYVVSDTRKGPRHIGFHWGHETFCWKSAEMSHHDSILRDIRNQSYWRHIGSKWRRNGVSHIPEWISGTILSPFTCVGRILAEDVMNGPMRFVMESMVSRNLCTTID